jgi:hypothetical protein
MGGLDEPKAATEPEAAKSVTAVMLTDPRKLVGPKAWSSTSHRRKVIAKRLTREGVAMLTLYYKTSSDTNRLMYNLRF